MQGMVPRREGLCSGPLHSLIRNSWRIREHDDRRSDGRSKRQRVKPLHILLLLVASTSS
jgi:hypothetical protein